MTEQIPGEATLAFSSLQPSVCVCVCVCVCVGDGVGEEAGGGQIPYEQILSFKG